MTDVHRRRTSGETKETGDIVWATSKIDILRWVFFDERRATNDKRQAGRMMNEQVLGTSDDCEVIHGDQQSLNNERRTAEAKSDTRR